MLSAQESPSPDKRKWWDFLATASVRGPYELRRTLPVDETGFRIVAGYSHADTRAYFIYKVLDEVQKTGVAIIRWAELLGEKPEEKGNGEEDEQVRRVILESVSEEQSLRLRKLIETLINLICFEQTNENDYYRHFLLLTDLDYYLSMQQDLREFHACPSGNVAESIKHTIEWASQLEGSSVDPGKCWYLGNRKPLVQKKLKGGIFSSLRSRLREALPLATPEEKLALGLTYHLFGEVSRDIHFTPSAPQFDLSRETVENSMDHCGLLSMPILLRCQRILGVVPEGINEQIRRVYDANEYPRRLLSQVTGGRAQPGDFVLAYGDLAEVLEVAKSPFGYEAYRVRYLAERPLPEVADDWFPAKYVQRLYTRDQWLQSIESLVAEGKLPEDAANLKNMQPDLQARALREALVHVWNLGLRDHIRSRARRG